MSLLYRVNVHLYLSLFLSLSCSLFLPTSQSHYLGSFSFYLKNTLVFPLISGELSHFFFSWKCILPLCWKMIWDSPYWISRPLQWNHSNWGNVFWAGLNKIKVEQNWDLITASQNSNPDSVLSHRFNKGREVGVVKMCQMYQTVKHMHPPIHWSHHLFTVPDFLDVLSSFITHLVNICNSFVLSLYCSPLVKPRL